MTNFLQNLSYDTRDIVNWQANKNTETFRVAQYLMHVKI